MLQHSNFEYICIYKSHLLSMSLKDELKLGDGNEGELQMEDSEEDSEEIAF